MAKKQTTAVDKLAVKIAKRLFTSGNGFVGTRLEIKRKDGTVELGLGGWGFQPAVYQITNVLLEEDKQHKPLNKKSVVSVGRCNCGAEYVRDDGGDECLDCSPRFVDRTVRSGMLFEDAQKMRVLIKHRKFAKTWWCEGVEEEVGQWAYAEEFIIKNKCADEDKTKTTKRKQRTRLQ